MSKQNRTLKVSYQPGHPDRPRIKLQGLWLKDFFDPGELVEVSTSFPDVMVISKPIDPETLPKIGDFFKP